VVKPDSSAGISPDKLLKLKSLHTNSHCHTNLLQKYKVGNFDHLMVTRILMTTMMLADNPKDPTAFSNIQ
jgi:hypothetical protein